MVQRGFAAKRKKLNWKLVVLIALAHILALAGLARLLMPEFTSEVIEQATSIVTVTVRTYEDEEPEAEPSIAPPQPDEGAAGDEGREATPRPVIAPPQPLPRPSPAPRATSTGTANTSGAREAVSYTHLTLPRAI